MISLRYRSDIDGLRAVAVLGVVIYHAFPKVVPGGFTGVDIFFVISGYLISGILYKGQREGNFSPSSFFLEFYARRVRRLFPALITVLLLSLGYGWLVLLPDEYQQLGKHVAAGTLFIQNIIFWKESGYFDIAANLKPMLHLWSLAVEEQFYIFFPPLLVLLWKRPRVLIPAMILLLVGTFIANVVMSYQDVVSDFFLTPYRAWEFLGGSLLAWWHYDKNHEEDVPLYREALSWAGLLLLALGMALLGKDQPYPGWRALLPVAGTLLLMEGGRGAWVNRKILSHPVMVWVGLISYPLYLFHWPALSFVHIVKGGAPASGLIWAALGVALLLTVLTYYFIEKKLRHNKGAWVLPALVGVFLITGVWGAMCMLKIIAPKLDPKLAQAVIALNDKDSFNGVKQHESEVGLFTVGGSGAQTVFVGDSNMQQYMPRIAEYLDPRKGSPRGAIFIVYAGLPAIPGFQVAQYKKGLSLIPELDEQIRKNPKIDRVVLAGLWCEYFTYKGNLIDGVSVGDPSAVDRTMQALGGLIRRLSDQGKKVTLILSIPYGDKLHPVNAVERGFMSARYKNPQVFTTEEFLSEKRSLLEKVKATALSNGASVIDPVEYLSTNGVCRFADDDGIPIQYDGRHLRPGYVREHVTYLDQTVTP